MSDRMKMIVPEVEQNNNVPMFEYSNADLANRLNQGGSGEYKESFSNNYLANKAIGQSDDMQLLNTYADSEDLQTRSSASNRFKQLNKKRGG